MNARSSTFALAFGWYLVGCQVEAAASDQGLTKASDPRSCANPSSPSIEVLAQQFAAALEVAATCYENHVDEQGSDGQIERAVRAIRQMRQFPTKLVGSYNMRGASDEKPEILFPLVLTKYEEVFGLLESNLDADPLQSADFCAAEFETFTNKLEAVLCAIVAKARSVKPHLATKLERRMATAALFCR